MPCCVERIHALRLSALPQKAILYLHNDANHIKSFSMDSLEKLKSASKFANVHSMQYTILICTTSSVYCEYTNSAKCRNFTEKK